jgi:putative Holliday junction resolvase
LLGIDFGTKRIGVALSTPDRSFASPLEILTRRDQRQEARFFQELVQDYRVVGLVVGLPVHVAGHESQKSHEARQFGAWLSQLTGLPVVYWDERYTSAVAEERMLEVDMTRRQRKGRMDKVAAQIILQAYLDHHRPRLAVDESADEEEFWEDDEVD